MASTPAPLPPRPPLPDVAPPAGVVELPEVAGGEVPVLAELADLADATDRIAARTVVLLTRVAAHPEILDGLSVQLWLEQACRLTSMEARRLLGTVDTLAHLPTVVRGLADGRLSWSQTVEIARAAKTVTVAQRGDLDRLIASVLDAYRDCEPDQLTGRVWSVCERWQPDRLEQAQAAAERAEHLTLMPRLFDGGSVYGEFGPASFATIAEALDAPVGPPVAADLDDPDSVDAAFDELDDRRRAFAAHHARDVAARLVALCEDSLAGTTHDGETIPPRPTAYIVTTADALCDRDRTPGWLLTTLTGGTLKANSTLIRQLLDQRGADLRGVILDDCGQVVGVGRKTYRPPDWMREATWARDLTDQAPGSATPVRRADLDHILPYDHGGTTDLDNLANLGRTPHQAKTGPNPDWTLHRARDGTLTWTHRTGLKVRRPPTWRGLDRDPPDPGPPRPPPPILDAPTLN